MAFKKISPFTLFLQDQLALKTGLPVVIRQALTINGGSINECYLLDTSSGKFFLKRNLSSAFPNMFRCELQGLERISQVEGFRVPEVILSGQFEEYDYFITEFINPVQESSTFWENFGTALANLHKVSNEKHGYEHDNYIGSLPQSNKQHNNWHGFFVNERLEPQVLLALNNKHISRDTYEKFQRFYQKLEHVFPVELPCFLHGDLWSGNFISGNNHQPYLIDPAVYFGHREMDIAMTKLFGGFHPTFYSAYNASWPLEEGWKDRIELCNLYPLLVHQNLFGGSYIKAIKTTLNKFD